MDHGLELDLAESFFDSGIPDPRAVSLGPGSLVGSRAKKIGNARLASLADCFRPIPH